jgi:hypothetical protein
VALPHPLQPDDYARAIKDAYIGLLLYNADVYFARCSGVLAELLAAGVPVIVPAGGWLAEQIAEENYCYLDQLAAESSATRTNLNRENVIFAPPGVSDLIVRVWRAATDQPGSYLSIDVEQIDAAGKSLRHSRAIVGQRDAALGDSRPAGALFHREKNCATVRVTLTGAYNQSVPAIDRATVDFLTAPTSGGPHWPAGRVGMTLAGPGDVPAMLGEIVSHHRHYKNGALAYSQHWASRHAAERTIEQLPGGSWSRSADRAAA